MSICPYICSYESIFIRTNTKDVNSEFNSSDCGWFSIIFIRKGHANPKIISLWNGFVPYIITLRIKSTNNTWSGTCQSGQYQTFLMHDSIKWNQFEKSFYFQFIHTFVFFPHLRSLKHDSSMANIGEYYENMTWNHAKEREKNDSPSNCYRKSLINFRKTVRMHTSKTRRKEQTKPKTNLVIYQTFIYLVGSSIRQKRKDFSCVSVSSFNKMKMRYIIMCLMHTYRALAATHKNA